MEIAPSNSPSVPNRPGGPQRRGRQFLYLALLFLSAMAASLFLLDAAPAPFFWLWLTWAAALFLAIFFVHRPWPQATLLNLGIVACLLAAAEGRLVRHEYTPVVYPDSTFFVDNDVLGWAPAKGIRARAVKYSRAGLLHRPRGLLFDGTYTIGSDGLRLAPPYRKDDLAGTVLFFGCSFTFGEGLSDNETLPYQVGVQSAGGYRTFNFGVQGYSPNQMLSAIEDGIVRRVVDTPPRYAFYVAIPDHVWRVAGRVPWGSHAPRYALDAGGTARRAGDFESRQPWAERLGLVTACKCGQCPDCETHELLAQRLGLAWEVRQINKSALWRRLWNGYARINAGDIRLYLAVVRRSQELLSAQYPGIQFHVVLWAGGHSGQQPYAYQEMQEGLRQMGIPLHLVENILPGSSAEPSAYLLSPVDPHPNALADRLLAKYLVEKVLP